MKRGSLSRRSLCLTFLSSWRWFRPIPPWHRRVPGPCRRPPRHFPRQLVVGMIRDWHGEWIQWPLERSIEPAVIHVELAVARRASIGEMWRRRRLGPALVWENSTVVTFPPNPIPTCPILHFQFRPNQYLYTWTAVLIRSFQWIEIGHFPSGWIGVRGPLLSYFNNNI